MFFAYSSVRCSVFYWFVWALSSTLCHLCGMYLSQGFFLFFCLLTLYVVCVCFCISLCGCMITHFCKVKSRNLSFWCCNACIRTSWQKEICISKYIVLKDTLCLNLFSHFAFLLFVDLATKTKKNKIWCKHFWLVSTMIEQFFSWFMWWARIKTANNSAPFMLI